MVNLPPFDNCRAITLSSALCALHDVVMLTKEKDNLVTSNLQFSLKANASTTLDTSICTQKRCCNITVVMVVV